MSGRALAAALAVVAGAAAWWAFGTHPAPRLPPEIVVEDVVADLSRGLDGFTVREQAPADPVRAGELRPGARLAGHGERPTLVAPPPARLARRLDVPAGGVLRFGVGVAGDGRRDPARSAVRFAVRVDGREVWQRTVNPAATRHDRRWFDERVDLGGAAGRTAVVELVTEAVDPGRALAGTPGWGTVRLVRETRHTRQPATPGAPNVLVLLVDTLRADRLGCYGAVPSPTPNLDRLAAEGLVFDEAIAQSSWTLPSVASLFTGLPPRSHGAIGDQGGDDGNDGAWGYLADGAVTWAEQAGRAGVTTIGVSANPLVSRGTNLAQGFETFVDLPWEARTKRWGAAPEVQRAFLDWLAPNRAHRFVAWLHYMEPHDPYTPPAALRPPVPPGTPPDIAAGWVLDFSRRLGRPDSPVLPADQLAYLRALYDGEITTWDAALPSLLAGLERLGVRDRTLVVVTSDHGEEFLEHGLLLHRAHLFDELIRVPLVIAGPGIAPGRRTDQVQGIDLFPTLAALLGFDPPALPGRPLLAPEPGRAAFSETDGQANHGQRRALEAIRQPEGKLIQAPATGERVRYDLVADPREQTPLDAATGDGPALRTALDRIVAAAPPPPARSGRDPALRDKLRALGYAQ